MLNGFRSFKMLSNCVARKLRIEYPGALYHVINRGNYRSDVFDDLGTVRSFEETLLEACRKMGWRLHAHVVMRNHYHLAVETPDANLGRDALVAKHVLNPLQSLSEGERKPLPGAI